MRIRWNKYDCHFVADVVGRILERHADVIVKSSPHSDYKVGVKYYFSCIPIFPKEKSYDGWKVLVGQESEE